MERLIFSILLIKTALAASPLVVNTWNFQNATKTAYTTLAKAETDREDGAVQALAAGCKSCQDEQCDGTVGYGGSPDENGETTLDAMIFDGNTMDMGAVGNLRRVKDAINVARHVLENTKHSILVGELSMQFALEMGFKEEATYTNDSIKMWNNWKENDCQPNFWKDVEPDPTAVCGPYSPIKYRLTNEIQKYPKKFSDKNHDTIGMIVISGSGHIVAGTSTNGARFKIPGRVGDSPIPGAGAYADSDVGAAVATGDGDVMMRFLPSFLAVEKLRDGMSVKDVAPFVINRIKTKYPDFYGAIVVVDKNGTIGVACNGMDSFPYTFANAENPDGIIKYVTKCT